MLYAANIWLAFSFTNRQCCTKQIKCHRCLPIILQLLDSQCLRLPTIQLIQWWPACQITFHQPTKMSICAVRLIHGLIATWIWICDRCQATLCQIQTLWIQHLCGKVISSKCRHSTNNADLPAISTFSWEHLPIYQSLKQEWHSLLAF